MTHTVDPAYVRIAEYYHGKRYADEMVYTVEVAQRWAPICGYGDNFFALGTLAGQLISRKYFGVIGR